MSEGWTQGNWNAWVVSTDSKAECKQRCRNVPLEFRKLAVSHARTYWTVAGRARPKRPRAARKPASGMFAPVKLVLTREDYEWGSWFLKQVVAQGNTREGARNNFGNRELGFAAERCVDRWLTQIEIEHIWHDDPAFRGREFEIGQASIDLKAMSTKGAPRPDWDADVTVPGAPKAAAGMQAYYLFGKHDNSSHPNYGDFYVVGFITDQEFEKKSVYYNRGETTRHGYKAKTDVKCVPFGELVPPMEWLNEKPA